MAKRPDPPDVLFEALRDGSSSVAMVGCCGLQSPTRASWAPAVSTSILVFARLRWTVWLAPLAMWTTVEFLVFTGALRVTPRVAVLTIVRGFDAVSVGLVCIALRLVLLRIRPLLVGFTPLIVLLVSAVGMNLLIRALDLQLTDAYPRSAELPPARRQQH